MIRQYPPLVLQISTGENRAKRSSTAG